MKMKKGKIEFENESDKFISKMEKEDPLVNMLVRKLDEEHLKKQILEFLKQVEKDRNKETKESLPFYCPYCGKKLAIYEPAEEPLAIAVSPEYKKLKKKRKK